MQNKELKMEKKFSPFYKWSGGKTKELEKVFQYMPESYDRYVEPFLGGGAVWLALNPDQSIVGDFYFEVVNFFSVLNKEGKSFVDEVNQIAQDYNDKIKRNISKTSDKKEGKAQFKENEEIYYYWRDKADIRTDIDKAKRFYVLRCLAYGGMLRFNKEGKFNIPFGFYKSFKLLDYPEGIDILLNNTQMYNQSWDATVAMAHENDFVFLDPPYTRKFQKYSSDGDFGEQEHKKLAEYFASKKSKCMIIINKDDFTESLYKDFIKEEYVFSYATRYRDRMSKEDATTYHILATNF
jgi:DNA adenine methylase